MTNIIATIVVTLSTNVYHPQQHKITYCHPTMPPQYVETWEDGPGLGGLQETRNNPDVRIAEVRRKRELVFMFEGKEHRILLEDTVVARKEERRTVKETWDSE